MIKPIAAFITVASLAHVVTPITIYSNIPGAIPTQFIGPNGAYVGLPAFDPVAQTADPAPVPPVPTSVPITLQTGTAITGLSPKQQRTDFVGISLEMSISDKIIGTNGTFLNPVFLNHIQNLRARSGVVSIRVGGNSQEKSSIGPPLNGAPGPTINKTVDTSPTIPGSSNSPILTISQDLLYAMGNVSSLVDVGWYFGLPFLAPQNIPATVSAVTTILGNKLLGFQMANEPDQYESHLKKPAPYQIPQYMQDWGNVRSQYVPDRTDLIAPNVCCNWTLDELAAAGFLTQYAQYLKFVAVQHYKDSACTTNQTTIITPAAAFSTYQTHASVQNFFAPYVSGAALVNQAGKDLVLLETNTASCGGFAGASDSYAAALYLLDLTLQAASIGIAQVLLHNGGSGQYYNLFTPPPGNMSSFLEWSTASPYYSALIMAEVMSEAQSQVMDLLANGNSTHTPAYAIYNNGNPIKLALFNYITDPTGANDVTFSVTVPSAPPSVKVKYFSTATGSVADKFNLTWAGQTMGDQFKSDGRLQGSESVQTIPCSSGVCNIPVKAPQFALVFLDNTDGVDPSVATQTFMTSVATHLGAGPYLFAPGVVQTSNGRGGAQEVFNIGGTSSGGKHISAAERVVVVSGSLVALVVAVVSGVWLVCMR